VKETELRFRQIHLDFHTSESIESIGSNFDSEEFAETLLKANVNSISCFARCHHGWLYFDSKAFPERKHPHLQKQLPPSRSRPATAGESGYRSTSPSSGIITQPRVNWTRLRCGSQGTGPPLIWNRN
jgi:hypothetical protein